MRLNLTSLSVRIKTLAYLPILLLALCALPGKTLAQTYCTPSWASSSYGCSYGMNSIQLLGYSGSRLNDAPSCSSAFLDRTSSVTALDLQQGGTYNDTVNVNYPYYTTVAIWIDFTPPILPNMDRLQQRWYIFSN